MDILSNHICGAKWRCANGLVIGSPTIYSICSGSVWGAVCAIRLWHVLFQCARFSGLYNRVHIETGNYECKLYSISMDSLRTHLAYSTFFFFNFSTLPMPRNSCNQIGTWQSLPPNLFGQTSQSSREGAILAFSTLPNILSSWRAVCVYLRLGVRWRCFWESCLAPNDKGQPDKKDTFYHANFVLIVRSTGSCFHRPASP